MILISVIIPTYKDDERLNKCIKSLNDQTLPKEYFEVIVVNNDFESDTQIVVKHNLNLSVLKESKPGSYAARNHGINYAKGEILAFTDSDCIPMPDWLEKARFYFEENTNVSRIGGGIKIFYKNKKPSIAELYEGVFAFNQESYVGNGTAMTANMISKKMVFEAVGLFDDNLLSGGDVSWGLKADMAGFCIDFAPSVCIRHPARDSVTKLKEKIRRTSEGIMKNEFMSNKENSIINIISTQSTKTLKSVGSIVFINRFGLNLYEKIKIIPLVFYLDIIKIRERVKFFKKLRRNNPKTQLNYH